MVVFKLRLYGSHAALFPVLKKGVNVVLYNSAISLELLKSLFDVMFVIDCLSIRSYSQSEASVSEEWLA